MTQFDGYRKGLQKRELKWWRDIDRGRSGVSFWFAFAFMQLAKKLSIL